MFGKIKNFFYYSWKIFLGWIMVILGLESVLALIASGTQSTAVSFATMFIGINMIVAIFCGIVLLFGIGVALIRGEL